MTFYRSGAQKSNVYKRDAFVTSWRFHNRAWQPQRDDRLSETSGTLWIHRGALTNQRCSLATGCGIKGLKRPQYNKIGNGVSHEHSYQLRPHCELKILILYSPQINKNEMEALYMLYGLELNMCVGIWSDRQFSLSHDFYVELVRSISVYFVLAACCSIYSVSLWCCSICLVLHY